MNNTLGGVATSYLVVASPFISINTHMNENWLLNKFKSDKKYNPFNDSYDLEDSLNTFSRTIQRDKNITFDKEDPITLISSYWFNKYYKMLYNDLNRAILNTTGNKDILIARVMSALNRDVYVLRNSTIDKRNEVKNFIFEDMVKFKVKSSIDTFGNVDVQSLVDVSVDILNIFLNYIRYIDKPEEKKSKTDIEQRREILIIIRICNLIYNVKNAYDTAVWENGYVFYDKISEKLEVKYKNSDYVITTRSGDFRLRRNIFGAIMQFYELWNGDNNFQNLIKKNYELLRKDKILYKIRYNQGKLSFQFRSGIDKEALLLNEVSQVNLDVYYSFIDNKLLPKLDNLNLSMLILMFSEIQLIFKRILDYKIDNTEINKIEDLEKFSYKIHENEMIKYLSLKTNFSDNQIKQFLKLLTYSGGRYDLWKRPLIKVQDYYSTSILIISEANILFLVDEWLSLGGYSLEKRGKLFEEYIKQDLTEDLQEKKYNFKIANKNKFRNLAGNFEEIDLLLNTKHSLIVGEIKCITYPLEPRDYNNALERLRKGAQQIIRKSKFIQDNIREFSNDIGTIENKEIIKLVITNYPFFSGMKIDDVVIVDFFLLKAYVNTGKLVKMKVESNKGKVTTSKDHNIEVFYDNEDDFSRNIKQYMENAPSINELRELFYIESKKITFDDVKPVIYIECAETKQDIVLKTT